MRVIIIFSCMIFLTVLAYSGDTSSSKIVGFSKDGKYLAFERSGTYDGSGFPYCELFIIYVDKNEYAVKPLHITDQGDPVSGELREDNYVKNRIYKDAVPLFSRFGIVRGKSLVQVPMKNLSSDLKNMRVDYKGKKYRLILKEMDLAVNCNEFGAAKIFQLQLEAGKNIKVLQRDKSLPDSRGCALGYRIHSAFLYKNKIAVFIEYDSPGFEGPDVRQILVTGVID